MQLLDEKSGFVPDAVSEALCSSVYHTSSTSTVGREVLRVVNLFGLRPAS